MTAREEILKTIHVALEVPSTDPAASYAGIARNYRCTGDPDMQERLRLLVDRLLDYDAEVLQVEGETDLHSAIATALLNASEDRALVAPSFPKAWLPRGPLFVEDNLLAISAIEGMPAVITTCEAAVASTGTIFLVHGEHQARRVLTLLPNHHICILHRDKVYGVLPEALTAVHAEATMPLTTISGPSATSDIEMTRIRGVHGPRCLTVILYG